MKAIEGNASRNKKHSVCGCPPPRDGGRLVLWRVFVLRFHWLRFWGFGLGFELCVRVLHVPGSLDSIFVIKRGREDNGSPNGL